MPRKSRWSMKYFIARNVENGEQSLYQSDNARIEKDCYVVVSDYDDVPVTAKVVEIISRHKALTSNFKPIDIIGYVDMSSWLANREKELDSIILIDKMEQEIKRVQLMDKLEKYAGKDPAILELWSQLNGHNNLDD